MWTSRRALALISCSGKYGVCRRMHLRARSSVFQSVVIRNGILIRSRVHRTTSIGGLPRASPSDRAPRGWGTIWGGGSKGWGKVTRSGLLGTPDLVLLRLNVISRRRPDQPCGAKSFWAAILDQYLPDQITSARSVRDPRARPQRSNPTARASRRVVTMSRQPRPSVRSASPSA